MNFDEMKQRGSNIRVHGNGFLQLDVGEGERIHVFGHPRLPRQTVSTPIHNHLRAHVLTEAGERIFQQLTLKGFGLTAPVREVKVKPREQPATC